MTTEATFQDALDADPTDWQTRLVFSDWLLDRGDTRWEGMRWLGMERKWPWADEGKFTFWWRGFLTGHDYSVLPFEDSDSPSWCDELHKILDYWFDTRLKAEDAFCRAYPALAAAHPAEFAVGVMV